MCARHERCKGRWHEKRADEGESRESGTVSEEVQLDLCKIGVLLAEIPMRPRFTERFFEELRALAAKAGVPGVVPDKAGVQGYDGDTGDLWDLTKSQIAATFTDVNKAAESYLAAREELVRRNLLLVTSVANKFRVPGVSFSDLVQEGTMGLMNAIDRYRPELGFRFSTYATQWIKQSVRRHIEWNGKGVRVPGYVQRALGVVEKFKDEHRERTGRTPTPDETAAALAGKTGDVKVDEAWLRLSAPAARMQVSIDQPRSNDKNASPMSCFLPDRGTSPQSEVLDRLELEGLREILNQGLASLTYREREVIELRFGLGGGESHTLEEVGEKLGVTRERVRQVQKNAIKKLQLRVGKRRDTGDEG
jgi:RNA polymerase sigma factor (sigma-70 family)